ncbi:WD repeat-containing protein 81 [Ischnura elegans]|uniref:WD repeat-containing protein 81 n=1 Tax=Ischnura elegans TaxID=197161 RepID=UPI001ED8B020|nr:WD repeat-containing protein 81 [Ischnura elegans]
MQPNMTTTEQISQELGIPVKYIKKSAHNDLFVSLIHKSWLRLLLKRRELPLFRRHDTLCDEEVEAWLKQGECPGTDWQIIFIRVIPKKREKVIPLPRSRVTSSKTEPPLTFSQLLHYVSQTNHKNLWKEAFKKYLSSAVPLDGKETSSIHCVDSDIVIADMINRIFGCPIVKVHGQITEEEHVNSILRGRKHEPHLNILPTICTMDSPHHFYIIHSPTEQCLYSVQDCVNFSPAALGAAPPPPWAVPSMVSCSSYSFSLSTPGSSSIARPLFVIYQLLQLMQDTHDRGLALGDLTLSHLLLADDGLWIRVLPCLLDNVHSVGFDALASNVNADHLKTTHWTMNTPSKQGKSVTPVTSFYDGSSSTSSPQYFPPGETVCTSCQNEASEPNLEQLMELWVRGGLSNFEYLMALNHLVGRRYDSPSYHPVLPWVMDFSVPNGGWRDLSKSKFRLNKGDRQLDLTFDAVLSHHLEAPGRPLLQVPHHVSDVLSEITYYVYMARQTAKSILCKHVRSKWVPAEYPSSIQRMHEWTPDECIPEFFTDPQTFKSIHEDLPDLEVPSWATSPEHFIEKHRQALESAYVSERLHHWIDLTFGYKLSGMAAVRAKNVCLHLVDGHTNLANSGVVQLFTHPHPHRVLQSPYFGKTPPKVYFPPKDKRKNEKQEKCEDEDHSIDEDDTSSRSLAFTKLLSRSRSSLVEEKQQQQQTETGVKSGAANMPISLPRDYNPAQPLLDLETLYGFLSKTLHKPYGISTSVPPVGSSRLGDGVNLKQAAAARRIREMQVLGCLVVELFLSPSFNALPRFVPISKRLALCRAAFLAENHSLPPCVRHATSLLLQLSSEDSESNLELKSEENTSVLPTMPYLPFRYPMIMPMGLPPPSAHQLLQPSISLFPFPTYFPGLYSLLRTLREYMTMREELDLIDADCSVEEDDNFRKERQLLVEKVSECMVVEFARGLVPLLPDLGEEGVALVLPHVRRLLEDPQTAVAAAWHLFEPVAKALGPRKAGLHLLEPIARLFEREGPGAVAVGRISKLYHRSFVLRLSVWLGLGVFLDRFVTSLVEAVGGYRDGPSGVMKRDAQEGFSSSSMQSHRPEFVSKSTEIEFPVDGKTILSPLDEDSSADSERNASQKSGTKDELDDKEDRAAVDEEGATDAEVEPEVFVFEVGPETEEEEPEVTTEVNREGPLMDHLMDQLELHSDALSADRLSLNDSLGREDVEGEEEERDVLEEEAEQAVNEEPNLDLASQSHTLNYSRWLSSQQGDSSEVSSVSAETVSWLAHRLGPVLSARHLSRNLLRMLTLCFLGEENLTPMPNESGRKGIHARHPCCISGRKLMGDSNASKVLECLSSIAALYGEQLILLQYLPHMWELAALCRRKLTPTLEAGLVGCLALLIHIVPFLSDATLMDQLQDNIISQVLLPCIRLISSGRAPFPSGALARAALTAKVLDALHLLALRVGVEMTRRHLSSALRRFFLAFDKAHGFIRERNEKQCGAEGTSVGTISDGTPSSLGTRFESLKDSPALSLEENSFLEICRDGTTAEWAVRGAHISHIRSKAENDSTDSASPPVVGTTPDGGSSFKPMSELRSQALEELKCVFSEEFAHLAYIPFFRFLGENVMEQALQNEQLIRDLCFTYEQEMHHFQPEGETADHMYLSDYLVPVGPHTHDKEMSQSFGSNVAVIGNRIDLQRADIPSTLPLCSSPGIGHVPQESEMISFISKKMENTNRHLRGNWLAYWEHEIGRSEKDSRFNFKQIKLQKFSGHGNSIRAVVVLDNENSFLSGSRDKTVKLWSLRSQGDGSAVTHCQWTYVGHRKSVLSVAMVEPLRLAASCDSALHLWDPFVGSPIRRLESTRYPPVCVLRPLPPPACTLLAATTDATLRLVDPRIPQAYLNDLKVSPSPWGLIRCVTVAPNGYWVAVGQSSGHLSILDIRTGLVLSSWKGHEGEVLQLVVVNENTLVSSSLDQAVSVWNPDDGKLKFNMKGPTEPVHCLGAYGSELISGTTANRIGVHTSLDEQASFSSTRLRSDAFRGVLTAMAVLPLNRLLLLGADNGSLTLLC